MGIEVTLQLFSKQGLITLFSKAIITEDTSENVKRIFALQQDYIHTIDNAIQFLQGKKPTLAHLICKRNYLPEAKRFAQTDDLAWAFGSMGIQDKAKHLATMYLEDLADFITESVDHHFGFSRYAERLGRSANSFDELYLSQQQPYTYIDDILIELLKEKMANVNPKLVCISVPFPGNLYSSLRCGQWIKKNYPSTKVAMGGGFANTELRGLSDARVFAFFDFITLDDGEAPIENLIGFIEGTKQMEELKRTFLLTKKPPQTASPNPSEGGALDPGNLEIHQKKHGFQNSPLEGMEALEEAVTYINNSSCKDYKQGEVGTPDYSDFLLSEYISAIEVVNPMHRLWSDGRWNKLTMAHGCYWGKCTFCDISLDYIKLYEPSAASLLCNRMEEMMAQTGENGFHFVDEAAPPALMRALSLEIIKRKLTVSWWTNIRFEKSFTKDLCLLLKAAGCIAVSGGLEVASDRLLELIQKGITVAQVARVNRHFTEAGIMVHAYLMYGFPTQTAQETIDSLEMVRQMFQAGILQSGFWHQFAMTAHSPVGLNPEKFGVKSITNGTPTFANNDVVHEDPTGADHDNFSFGLKKSLFNFMNGIGFEEHLNFWFDFKVPKTKVDSNYIANALEQQELNTVKPTSKVVWLGHPPVVEYFTKSKKGNSWQMASITVESRKETFNIKVDEEQGKWLAETLNLLSVNNAKTYTLQEVKDSYEAAGLEDFELFWDNKPVSTMNRVGLLVL